MKKYILGLVLILLSLVGLSQVVAPQKVTATITALPSNTTNLATNANQTIANNTLTTITNSLTIISNSLNALYNKIDTTTKVFVITFTSAVTYSAANVQVLGASSPLSWSIALGSQYWTLESATLLDRGGNYGLQPRLFLLNDSINAGDNVPVTWTTARARKVEGYLVYTGLSWLGAGGQIDYFTTITSGTGNVPLAPFTGNVWFMITSVTISGSSNQAFKLKVSFRKLKN